MHSRTTARAHLASRAALLAIAVSLPLDLAMAQPVEPAAASLAPDDAGQGEAIVVTARRRQEKAQDVPIALSVIGQRELERTGHYSLGQIQQQVPSLQVFGTNARNTNINIRGLGSNISAAVDGLENGVGFYIDNVYYGRVGATQFDLVDLERIEVLRGPQGTLFGKNTTAGAINITSRAPSFEPEASGEISFGNYGYHQVRASASGPLIGDKLAARLSVSDTHRDGFLTNVRDGSDAQDHDNFSVRGQLLAKPADDVTIRLIGDYSKQKQNFILNVPVAYFTQYDSGVAINNNILQRAQRLNYTLLPATPFARRGDADAPFQSDMETYGISGELNWDFGGTTLTSISAYRWWNWAPTNDADATGLPVQIRGQVQNRQRQFSQEVRLGSNGDGNLDWVLGAYYFWQTVPGRSSSRSGSAAGEWNLPSTNPANNPVISNLALNNFGTDGRTIPKTRSFALFGQANWDITDRLSLTGGLRFTHEKKDGFYQTQQVGGADLATSGLTPAQIATAQAIRNRFAPVANYTVRHRDNSLSGLVTLGWKATPDALLYATYARGSKSGGLNLTNLPAGVSAEVDPEQVDHFELGLKSDLFDRHLRFNLAGFWTEISDYQTAVSIIPLSGPQLQYISNIPKVRSRGIEVDLNYAPSRWFSVSASAAYVDATYRDYRNAPNAPENNPVITAGDPRSGPNQDLSGARLPGASKFTYTLGADVSQPVGSWGSRDLHAYAHADYARRSSYNTNAANSRFGRIPSYGLLNGRIGLRTDDGAWDVALWARNLTDKNYFINLNPGAFGLVNGTIGEPRTYGLTLRTKL